MDMMPVIVTAHGSLHAGTHTKHAHNGVRKYRTALQSLLPPTIVGYVVVSHAPHDGGTEHATSKKIMAPGRESVGNRPRHPPAPGTTGSASHRVLTCSSP